MVEDDQELDSAAPYRIVCEDFAVTCVDACGKSSPVSMG